MKRVISTNTTRIKKFGISTGFSTICFCLERLLLEKQDNGFSEAQGSKFESRRGCQKVPKA